MSSVVPGAHTRLRPLTERILARLPGSRLVWIAAWALVPWLNAGANLLLDTGGTSAVWEQAARSSSSTTPRSAWRS